ncbi:transcriptional regulator, LacI family [Paenibacillus sp. yr247]|uniref:LacI family DNA-binding transcriptional regulator n=1 Tax=Paenibacillus sp. yr247 TaxID=1761880 RepID=UPI000886617F|nr:LacI family DNA-binding transcriptional regulator [Paenibacillus sp. yr247]SDO19440.1 transcriptional regulator, LacI family [Paenibacillus sp. yr247]
MTTIKDVALRAGVAVSTASYALSGSSKISRTTREKVQQAAKELNYQKNGFAMDLKRRSSKTILLILKDLSGPYYSELIRGVQAVTISNGFDLIACSSVGGSDSTAYKFLTERRVDGAIVLDKNIETDFLRDTAREGCPIVCLDRIIDSDFIMNISADNIQGGFLAAEHLIQLGHRDIGWIGGPVTSFNNQLRKQGFLNALKLYDIQERQKWMLVGNFTQEGGYHATKLLLMNEHRPTAIFYANDEMALGGYKAIREKGLSIPADLSVIGFDDIHVAEYIHPALTTIRQPKFEIGTMAAHLILQALSGEYVKRKHELSIELIARDSTIRR